MGKNADIYLPNLPELKWVQTIRDPIWGEIPITEVEKQIIQTEAFYRLRGIKQLSFAYLAFPGAVHSRFEHSLGVMHVTDMLLKMVSREDNKEGIIIESFHRQILRLAALLHDIGHPPFSHAMENLFTHHPDLIETDITGLDSDFQDFLEHNCQNKSTIGNHETYSEYIISSNKNIIEVLKTGIKNEYQDSMGGPTLESRTKDIHNTIARLAVGKATDDINLGNKLNKLIRIFKSIVSGDIDADKIDYLMRDNYYCGLPYGLDLASLRNNLIPREWDLEIQPEALDFVHSLILARHRLIKGVHQEKWNVFATAKVIELLYELLKKENKRGELLFNIFTQWDDSDLLKYLIDSGDTTVKDILTTQYSLKEIVRLDFIETHPYIRECIQVLSEPINHRHIPEFQKEIRKLCHQSDLYIHIHCIKSPEFSMRLVSRGNLLRDEILRGISEESIKNLHIIVYGKNDITIDIKDIKDKNKYLPCTTCYLHYTCINNLKDNGKVLLANLAVRRYRIISDECGINKIISADFLLLIMRNINEIASKRAKELPTRQEIYKIAKLIYQKIKQIRNDFEIHGNIGIKDNESEITSTFYQEIRKYEQLGLISYERQYRLLPSEDDLNRQVYRFDRRFKIQQYGLLRLQKVKDLSKHGIAFKEYSKVFKFVEQVIGDNINEIAKTLSNKKNMG